MRRRSLLALPAAERALVDQPSARRLRVRVPCKAALQAYPKVTECWRSADGRAWRRCIKRVSNTYDVASMVYEALA